MGNVHMEAKDINYRGGQKKMSVEEAIKNAGNTGLAHTADIAPEFSATTAYNAGDIVYYNGSLYEFTADHAAGAWSTSDTQSVTVGGKITSLSGDVTDLNDVKANQLTIAPVFSAETAYDPGDLVYHNGLTYRCVNSHEGEWDADDFAATTIANELGSLKSGLTNHFVNLITANAISVANTAKAGTTIAKAQLRHDNRFAELVINITNADSFDTGDTGVMLNIDWSKTGVSFNEFKSACGTCNTNADYPDYAHAGAISAWTLYENGDVYMRLSETGIKAARLCFVFKLAW